jgi:hypothetical protein
MKFIWLVAVIVPLAVGVVGYMFVGQPELKDDATKVAAWGVIVNLLAALGAIIAGIAAYSSYTTTQETERTRRYISEIERDYAPKFAVLERAKTVVGLLVEEKDFMSEAAKTGIREFWGLYYGGLIGVENKEVESAMVSFGGALKEAEKDNSKGDDLADLSLALSKAVVEQVKNLRVELDTKKAAVYDN